MLTSLTGTDGASTSCTGVRRAEPYEPIAVADGVDTAGLYRTAYARVSRATITDTELQVGQFVVPEYNSTVTDDSHEARYLRSFKEMLPEEHVSSASLSQGGL
jgi:hypothetical protein